MPARLTHLTLGALLGGASFVLAYRMLLARSPLEEADPLDVRAPVAPVAAAPPAHRLVVGGRERTFLLHRPSAVPAHAPLWIVLHGSGGSGDEMRRFHGGAFDRLADREGMLVAYPDGYEEHWNDCRPHADYAANLENIDDVGFLRALVGAVHAEEGIDLDRVTVIGISNGGHMAFRLAFEAPELAQVYVALLANLPAPGNDDCRHLGAPVPMLLINGSEDPINPAGGGLVDLAGNVSRGVVLSAEETAREFARLAGHDAPPEVRVWPERSLDDGTSIESTIWQRSGKPEVEWIRIIGGGHSVPTRTPLPAWPPEVAAAVLAAFGRQSTEFETAEIIFAFSSSARASLL